MELSTYEKSCNGMYLEKYAKNGNLMRTAELFSTGTWVVFSYEGKDLSGEYTNDKFQKIRKHFK